MKTETVDGAVFETWTPAELSAAFDRDEVVLIDVRTPQEYMFEHIEGALLMPMAFFNANKLPGQSDKKIVFHCGSGARSERVSRAAIKAGVTHIAHLEGLCCMESRKAPLYRHEHGDRCSAASHLNHAGAPDSAT